MSAVLTKFPEVRRATASLRIAIVHEWFESYAGSERVVEQLLNCFLQADVFAVVDFMPAEERGFLRGKSVHTTFIQRMPLGRKMFRNYLGLMPLALQQLDLSGYDLVISSHHAVAKSVLTGPDQLHICYMHSPMRYAWDLQHDYVARLKGLRGAYARWLLAKLRVLDVCSANGVDHFIANSNFIARRINKVYRRQATVIHPPVDTERFSVVTEKDDFYLLANRFVAYKHAEVVVESFARNPHRRLVVVGDGPDRARVHAAANGATNITFQSTTSQARFIDLMQRARAYVFAGYEDFGITMAEAQACGTPLIAYGHGGAEDIVVSRPHPTGVLFSAQTADSVSAAITYFETVEQLIRPGACRANAMRFSQQHFCKAINEFVARALSRSRILCPVTTE